jgi:sulfur-oxidizing protein SoxZ
MTQPRTLVTIPPRAKKGEVVTVRALAQHAMENGFRHDEYGKKIPRDMIDVFRCQFNGVEVFRAELIGGIAANPLMQFTVRVMQSGRFDLTWEGDNGYLAKASANIEVS